MGPALNFLRLMAAFAVATILNLSWQDQILQRPDGAELLGWVGLGSNLGFFTFGVSLILLSWAGHNLPASKWPFSLAGLLVIYFVGSPTALYVNSTAAIVFNSAGLTLFHQAFFAQLTATAIDGSDFRLSRRGGTIGYGIAFAVASVRWPELSLGLVILATVSLLMMIRPQPSLVETLVDENAVNSASQVTRRSLWLQIVPILILFSLLGACGRVYDSFGPPMLLGTWDGLLAIGSLLTIEVVILPLTVRLKGSIWVVASVFAWIAAYGSLWLGSPWLIFGVSLISINCCGQVVIQERAQALAKRGSANLQALLLIGSAMAAGVVSTMAVPWSRSSTWPIWALGLFTALVALLIVFVTLPFGGVAANASREVKVSGEK
jgi:hypothetical protein